MLQFVRQVALEEGPRLQKVPREKPSPLGQRSGAFERPVTLLTPQADEDAGAGTDSASDSQASSSETAGSAAPPHTPKARKSSRTHSHDPSTRSSTPSVICTPPLHDRPTPGRSVVVPAAPELQLSPEGKHMHRKVQLLRKHSVNADSHHAEYQVHELLNSVGGFKVRPNQQALRPGIQVAEMRQKLGAKPVSHATSTVWLRSFESELHYKPSEAELAQLHSIAFAKTEVDLTGSINGELLSRLPLRDRKQRTVTLPLPTETAGPAPGSEAAKEAQELRG